ncbi:MAG: GTP-binding protein, partial [Planctomycetota bacterium]
MAVDSKNTVQALKIYKEIGMSLKDFKTKCAEIGVVVKGAVSKLSIEEAEKVRAHLGIKDPDAVPAVEKVEDDKSTANPKVKEPKLPAKSEAELAAEAAEVARAAEVEEMKKGQARLSKKLGVDFELVDFVSQTLGVSINNVDDVDDGIVKRASKLHSVIRIAKDFDTSPREISIIAQNIGIRIGGKSFKGLSVNEEFMLKAMVKQKFTTREERLKEVQVHDDKDHKPAAPTGNKAVEARQQTQRQTKQKGRTSHEQTREVIPSRFAGQGGGPSAQGGPGGGAGAAARGGRGGGCGRKRFDVTTVGQDRRGRGGRRGGRRRGDDQLPKKEIELPTGPVTVELPLNLRQLSEYMGTKTSEIQKLMLTEGLPMMRINDSLSKDIIEQIGIIFDREITVTEPKGADDLIQEQLEAFGEEAGEEVSRAPIVTVMGHVDHGKTSLLDAIAKLDRVSGESGGITQHIGAFRLDLIEKDEVFAPHVKSVKIPEGARHLEVTFIDTPGHEAFTAMRARGANATDIAVIVVAADDGIMPQTKEAISHARSAEVEIVIAITKIDKPEANLARVRQQLATENLMSPEWGGTTEIIELSSITGEGINKLVHVLSDFTDIMEITAVAEKPAVGVVLEANRDVGRGIVATILVKEGTLKKGDVIVAGHGYGRVRAMQESRGDG